jgi:hypothetical protein
MVATVKHKPVDMNKIDLSKLVKFKEHLITRRQQYDSIVRPQSDSNAINWAVVINVAEKAWAFIEKNKAVEDYQQHHACAIPKVYFYLKLYL